jgi:Flp pilus assembly protein CpaB
VVGGALVVLAAVGAYLVATAADDGTAATVVVATRPLTVGEPVTAEDLRTVPADLPGAALDRLVTTTDLAPGSVALAAIEADQPVPRTAVGTAPAGGDHDLSFALERHRALDGRLRPGDLVDVVATFGAGADATTEFVVRGIRVVDVHAPSSGTGATSATVTLTVALDGDDDVLRTAHALELAKVSLVRSTGSDGP